MAQETLLIVLIAILAMSWLAVAVVVVLIGLRVLRLIDELQQIAKRLRLAGEAAAADVAQLRERLKDEGAKVRGIVDYALGFFMKKLPAKRRKRVAIVKEDLD